MGQEKTDLMSRKLTQNLQKFFPLLPYFFPGQSVFFFGYTDVLAVFYTWDQGGKGKGLTVFLKIVETYFLFTMK